MPGQGKTKNRKILVKKRDTQLLKFLVDWMTSSDVSTSRELAAQSIEINRHDILYQNKIASFPIARFDRDTKTFTIDFHTRYKTIILRLIALDEHLAPYVDSWQFVQYLFPEKEGMDACDLHYSNLFNIIDTHIRYQFHVTLNATRFTLPDMLVRYIQHYDCIDIFENVCSRHLNSLLARKWWDSFKHVYVYVIDRETAATLNNISRKVIIDMMIKQLELDEAEIAI